MAAISWEKDTSKDGNKMGKGSWYRESMVHSGELAGPLAYLRKVKL